MIEHVSNPLLEAHNLSVVYTAKPVLWNIDFTLPGANMVGIIGPNGAGKSTLLKSMLGLIKPASGYALFFGEAFEKVRARVAYVAQRQQIDWNFPATVNEVVSMGRFPHLGLFKSLGRKDKEIVDYALELVQMQAFKDRPIARLSGGQQQRVFIARALCQQPDLYLFDEPFAGIDAATEASLVALMKRLVADGRTVVVVHHDLQSVSQYFDWLLMLNASLVASGPTTKVFNDALLSLTYGGKLSLLSQVGDALREQKQPFRPK